MRNSYLVFIILCFSPFFIFSQISGTVSDENGDPLPFVNIHIKNTSVGTTTNFEGQYTLKIKDGSYSIVYQYVGYQTVQKETTVNNNTNPLNITLIPQEYELETIEINAQAEDPAYAIIRKAQAKRKYYKDLNSTYECDAYVRGFNKILNAPEKIMGQEVGDLEGALDSTRQGVVYLSESVSKLYVDGNKSKEILYSSKVSGDDQGYSFNSAQEMEFDFYDNNLDLNRKIISPIASSAMIYYDYILEGTQYEDDGQLVNKIKVIPKNEHGPAFLGYIYINEDLWNIHSLELSVTSKATQIPFIDTLTFRQIFIPIESERWMPLSNVIRFKMGALGFKVAGNFNCVYSSYILDKVDKSIFNNEIFKVEKEANERTEAYWDSLRPIPLTLEESVDYKRKDSIRIVRESPEYMDSIDRVNNKFKIGSILTGHSIQNSQKRSRLSYTSPISALSINTIQGLNSTLGLGYSKNYNKKRTKRLRINTTLNYGFSEKVWRPTARIFYQANRLNNFWIRVQGGKKLTQYNSSEPISMGLNSILTYFVRRNHMKAYDKEYAEIKLSRNFGNIFLGQLSLNYENRNALVNNYDKSVFYKESRSFTSNNPLNGLDDQPAFDNHQALILHGSLRIKIGEKVWSYPDQKYRVGSDWPSIWVHYKKAIDALGGDVNYDLLYGSILKRFSPGAIGNTSILAKAGKYLTVDNIEFADHYHFNGNQTHIGNPFNYYHSFLMLPYYDNSTKDAFTEFHLTHHFKGFLLSKLPLFKKLEWQLAGGVKFLNTTENEMYSEFHLGIDNIGYKIFRIFRVDAVWSLQDCGPFENCSKPNKNKFGVVVGVTLDL